MTPLIKVWPATPAEMAARLKIAGVVNESRLKVLNAQEIPLRIVLMACSILAMQV